MPGKAGLGKVFRSCRRPHRHPRKIPQRRIRLLNLRPQVRRYGDASDQLLCLLNVLLIDGRDQLTLDCFGCGCISAGINNKPRWDGKPCCGAFPEISALAAHECEVVTADIFKPMNHLLLLPTSHGMPIVVQKDSDGMGVLGGEGGEVWFSDVL